MNRTMANEEVVFTHKNQSEKLEKISETIFNELKEMVFVELENGPMHRS